MDFLKRNVDRGLDTIPKKFIIFIKQNLIKLFIGIFILKYSILNIFYFIYFIIIILNYFIYSNIMSILFILINK